MKHSGKLEFDYALDDDTSLSNACTQWGGGVNPRYFVLRLQKWDREDEKQKTQY